jgi:hypothetical protein
MAILAISRPRALALSVVLCGAAVAGYPAARGWREARERRACQAICKTLAGAAEMYNLDK